MKNIRLIATSTFGLESCIKREAQRLGFENIKAFDGRVEFDGDESDIVKANIWMRFPSKILIKNINTTATLISNLLVFFALLPLFANLMFPPSDTIL